MEIVKRVNEAVVNRVELKSWSLIAVVLIATFVLGALVLGPMIVAQLILIEVGFAIGSVLVFKGFRRWNAWQEQKRKKALSELLRQIRDMGADQDEIVRPVAFSEPCGPCQNPPLWETTGEQGPVESKGFRNALRRVARR